MYRISPKPLIYLDLSDKICGYPSTAALLHVAVACFVYGISDPAATRVHRSISATSGL